MIPPTAGRTDAPSPSRRRALLELTPLGRHVLAGRVDVAPQQPRGADGRWLVGGDGDAMSGLRERIRQPDGGFTYNVLTGQSPTTGYCLSPYPDRSVARPASSLSPVDLVDYVRKNHDLLDQPDHFLGAWNDPSSGKVFLDVSVVKANPAEAAALCRRHDQLAYFDLVKGSSVVVDPKATSGGVA